MKINGTFVLRTIAGDSVLIPLGDSALDINGMIPINPTGALIWQGISDGKSREEILDLMMDLYDIDAVTAGADLDEFIAALVKAGLITE